MFGAELLVVVAGLVAVVRANGLPSCYIEPYAAALNTTTCGPLDVECICQSNTYLNTLQDDVPQACDITDQNPIFSYVMAACSEFGVSGVTLSMTNVPLTTSSIPTKTVTMTMRITGTISAGATGIADSLTSPCPKQALSSGASIAIIIGAFCLGGLLFAAGALIMLRRRKSRGFSERLPDTPYTPYTPSTAYDSQVTQNYEKPLPLTEVSSMRPRAELMMPENTGSGGQPAELS